MKKFLAIAAATVISVFCFAGCGGQSQAPSVLADKPWDNNNGFESIEYTVEKNSLVYGADGTSSVGGKEASGKYSTTLEKISGNIYASDVYSELCESMDFSGYFKEHFGTGTLMTTPGAYSVVSTGFNLTYESGQYSGKTDTMESVVVFKSASLEPVFSYKAVENESDGTKYEAVADYIAKKNYFALSGNYSGATETGINGKYDNEMLAYVIRGRSGITTSTNEALSFNNAVYSGIYETADARTIAASVTASGYFIQGLDEDRTGFVKDYFDESAVDYYETETLNAEYGITFPKGYAIRATGVSIKLNTENSGSTSVLYYSVPNFSCLGQVTSSVLLQMTTYEYDVAQEKPVYAFNYKISDYKTSKIL